MVIGYLFESFLGFTVALGLELVRSISSINEDSRFRASVLRACSVFFDCVLYFAASIQIACVVVLVRKDFGISANSLGGLTVQITWAVALLSLLPLLYPLVTLGLFVREGSQKELEKADTPKPRHEFRFYLFTACWPLFMYSFVSRMIGTFAPSQVGEGAGDGGTTIIYTSEWDNLNALCFSGPNIQQLTDTETEVLDAFETAGSIIVSLFFLCPLIWIILQFLKLKAFECSDETSFASRMNRWVGKWAPRITLILFPILTVVEIWGVFRIRNIQELLANTLEFGVR